MLIPPSVTPLHAFYVCLLNIHTFMHYDNLIWWRTAALSTCRYVSASWTLQKRMTLCQGHCYIARMYLRALLRALGLMTCKLSLAVGSIAGLGLRGYVSAAPCNLFTMSVI